jgi:hypothetical protein
MQRKSVSFVAVSFVLFSAALFVTAARASERQERVVHSFGGGKDGNQVNASLVLDAASNLYGTTTGGALTTRALCTNCRFKLWEDGRRPASMTLAKAMTVLSLVPASLWTPRAISSAPRSRAVHTAWEPFLS